MEPLISVIMPVYNVEKYLSRSIDSILNQTYSNIELIIVDDGSIDKSADICDEYARKYSNIIVYHKSNGGQSSARNVALDNAKGEYIGFVDSDDWIEPEMYKTMYKFAKETRADIVQCGVRATDEKWVDVDSKEKELYIFESYFDVLNNLVDPNSRPVVRFEIWNKLFKRNIIGDIRFRLNQVYEEMYFDLMVFRNANKIVNINRVFYHYQICRIGNTNSSYNQKRLIKFHEIEEYISLLRMSGKEEIAKKYEEYGAHTAICSYVVAYRNNASQDILIKLVDYFNFYYKKRLGNKNLANFHNFIFGMSPKLFLVFSDISKLLRVLLSKLR